MVAKEVDDGTSFSIRIYPSGYDMLETLMLEMRSVGLLKVVVVVDVWLEQWCLQDRAWKAKRRGGWARVE